MLKPLVFLMTLICPLFGAHAQPRDVASIPIAQCSFAEVIGTLQFDSIQRAALIAKQSLPLLSKLEAIISKGTKPGVALKDQLPAADQVEFTKVSQLIAAGNLAAFIESHRGRDLHVLGQFIRLADQEYRWQKTPNEGEQDYIPYTFLVVMRVAIPTVQVTTPSLDRCSMDYALHQIEDPILDALGKVKGISDGVAFMNSMSQKYPGLDVSKMSKPDADLFVKWRQYLQPAFRQREFITTSSASRSWHAQPISTHIPRRKI